MPAAMKVIQPILFVVATIVVAVSTTCNGSNEPEALQRCPDDEVVSPRQKGALDAIRERRNEKIGPPQEGESIVTIGELSTGDIWGYRAEHATPFLRGIVDGEYRLGLLSEREVLWSPPNSDALTLGHEVVIGREVWDDSSFGRNPPLDRDTAGRRAWIHCDSGDRDTVLAAKDVVFGDTPETRDNAGNPCGMESCPLFIIPGSKVRVRDPIESTVDGEKLTTYEVVGFAKDAYHMWRATMTVDEASRLRGATVWNNDTGDVYLKLTAGPEPGRPPITDPTSQPRFTQQPPPPRPTPSTVPPGQRPAL